MANSMKQRYQNQRYLLFMVLIWNSHDKGSRGKLENNLLLKKKNFLSMNLECTYTFKIKKKYFQQF